MINSKITTLYMPQERLIYCEYTEHIFYFQYLSDQLSCFIFIVILIFPRGPVSTEYSPVLYVQESEAKVHFLCVLDSRKDSVRHHLGLYKWAVGTAVNLMYSFAMTCSDQAAQSCCLWNHLSDGANSEAALELVQKTPAINCLSKQAKTSRPLQEILMGC